MRFAILDKMRILCGTFLFGVWVFECLSWSFELELESGIGDLRILCGKFSLGIWVFELELELVNVANVKISSSNVASFQLGIGIGIGNISTMATFTSVGVGEWSF